jgi:cell division protein FtsI (penicillin-binding protein 3)
MRPQTANKRRLVGVFVLLFAAFSLLVVQFYQLQIVEGDKWRRAAESQHQLAVTIPFKRGLFYSNAAIREGHPDLPQPFVVDVPKFHLHADPKVIPQERKEEVARALASFLGVEERVLKVQLERPSRNRKLALWLDRERQEKILQWWRPYAKQHKLARNALFFVQDYQRSYPFGRLLGQVLHTVRAEKDAHSDQCIPTGGVELVFNAYLQGKPGRKILLRSPRQALDGGRILAEPEDGADVYLTINHILQAIAEEEIEKAVLQAHASGGWAILMEPVTGEILALAQYPWFDPASYRTYFNDPVRKQHTEVKAATAPFEPGSTMKPLTLAIALQANEELKRRGKPPLFSPQEKISTLPKRFPGRSKPVADLRTHRFLNMDLALQKSSNVYMATLAHRIMERLGEGWYRSALQETFGFGLKTGIELPSESAGLLPTPGKKHPNGALEWSQPTPYSLAFGHNLLVNSFQLLKCYAILANGGYDVQPTLVRKIVKGDCVLLDHTGRPRSKRVLEAHAVQQVVRAMKAVTKPGGTAPKADIYGYTEAGKTATTEKIVHGVYSKRDHISTFIGFAPAEQARFVLLIAIDDPEFAYIPGVGKNQHGGQCAAPAFREIGRRALEYLGVEPDDPHGYPSGDPRCDPEKADWIKQTKELRELYRKWNEAA